MTKTMQQQHELGSLETVQKLKELLGLLYEAQCASNHAKANHYENQIVGMVEPGRYRGFAGDDLRVTLCEVQAPHRRDTHANAHTFGVSIRVVGSDGQLGEILELDMLEFVAPINRPGHCDISYVGPRFQRIAA